MLWHQVTGSLWSRTCPLSPIHALKCTENRTTIAMHNTPLLWQSNVITHVKWLCKLKSATQKINKLTFLVDCLPAEISTFPLFPLFYTLWSISTPSISPKHIPKPSHCFLTIIASHQQTQKLPCKLLPAPSTALHAFNLNLSTFSNPVVPDLFGTWNWSDNFSTNEEGAGMVRVVMQATGRGRWSVASSRTTHLLRRGPVS